MNIYTILLNFFLSGVVFCEYDIGFENLFVSNTQEVENLPMKFNMTLPDWLRGSYIRNGLGRFEMGNRSFGHAFDAFGKLSSWKFPGNGSCLFSTKFIMSDFYNKSLAMNDIYPDPLLMDTVPPFTQQERFDALKRTMDNMNVNIYKYLNEETKKEEYVLLNDCWQLNRVEPTTLTTLQYLNPEVPDQEVEYKGVLSSAHPLPEPGTNNRIEYMTSMSLIPGLKHKVQVMRIKSTNVREQIAAFHVNDLRYMHSFSVTQNYAVFFQVPFSLNVIKMFTTGSVFTSFDWSDTDPINVFVVNLKTGKVQDMQTENGFLMHHINAYETTDSKIIIDAPIYKDFQFLTMNTLNVLRNKTQRNKYGIREYLNRYIIDLKSNQISLKRYYNTTSLPTASRIDMPAINENYRFKEYCYVYGIAEKIDDVNQARWAIAKKDLCGNTTDRTWYVENHFPSEAWFVPRPGGTSEDDGVLLSQILDGVNAKNYLAIIDPKTLTTLGVADIPIRNPLTTHGRFFADLV